MEYVDIVDLQDQVIGRATKDESHAQGLFHRGAGVLIFKDATYQELLLEKRSGGVREERRFCHPGGHVGAGESYLDAARREITEELCSGQCPPALKKCLENLEHLFTFFKDEKPDEREFIAIYRGVCAGPFVPLVDEVESIKFFPLSVIAQMMKERREKFTYTFQCVFEKYINTQEVLPA